MWRLERAPRHCVRIGRHAIELWTDRASALECIGVRTLATRTSLPGNDDLQAGLRALLAGHEKSRVTLVLESALMPALLVEAGADLWRSSQMQALLRHRLDVLYTPTGGAAPHWETRLIFSAGEPAALGFGLSSALKDALVQACAAAHVECLQLVPAFAWGLRRLESGGMLPRPHGWLGWAEQDRLLLARIERGRVASLNAAATPAADTLALARQIRSEGVRRGLPDDGAVIGTRWSAAGGIVLGDPLASRDAVTWVDIGRASAGTLTEHQRSTA